MGLLDNILNQAGAGDSGLGGLTDLVLKNPQALSAVASMLNPRDTSVGGGMGLSDIMAALTKGGLADVALSWVGSGPNQPVDPGKLTSALGPDLLKQFAKKAGVGEADAGSVLASVLPQVVNHVTPKGTLPDAGGLESMLGSLLGGLGGQ